MQCWSRGSRCLLNTGCLPSGHSVYHYFQYCFQPSAVLIHSTPLPIRAAFLQGTIYLVFIASILFLLSFEIVVFLFVSARCYSLAIIIVLFLYLFILFRPLHSQSLVRAWSWWSCWNVLYSSTIEFNLWRRIERCELLLQWFSFIFDTAVFIFYFFVFSQNRIESVYFLLLALLIVQEEWWLRWLFLECEANLVLLTPHFI
jgi:hypothetical protein